MQYKVVIEFSGSMCDAALRLEEELKNWLNNGWNPQGGVNMFFDKQNDGYVASQAIVK